MTSTKDTAVGVTDDSTTAVSALSDEALKKMHILDCESSEDNTQDRTNDNTNDRTNDNTANGDDSQSFSFVSENRRSPEERLRERTEALQDVAAAAAVNNKYIRDRVNAPAEGEDGGRLLKCEVAVAERSLKGEDTYVFEDVELNGRAYKMVCVFDGHGGKFASEFCRDAMIQWIIEAAASIKCGGSTLTGLEAAIEAAFFRAHERVRSEGSTGCTCTVAVFDALANQVLCCNVGDSSLLVVDKRLVGFASVDHRLQTNRDEQNRVLRMGSKLAYATHPVTKQPAGPLRMWPGGLAVSRSIGDADCSDALISTPSFEVINLPPKGAVLLLCSDGIWDAMGMHECAIVVRQTNDASIIAKKIVKAALRNRGLRDDTTCIVVKIGRGCATKRSGRASPSDAGSDTGSDTQVALPRASCFAVLRRCFRREKPPDMDATSKGGVSFEEVYRGALPVDLRVARPSPGATSTTLSGGVQVEVEGGVAMDATSYWASDRIGHASSALSPMKAPAGTEPAPEPPVTTADGTRTAAVTRSDSTVLAASPAEPSPAVQGGNGPPMPIPPGRKIHFNEIGDGGISDMRYLGSGEFCSVFGSTLDGGHQIAIKMLRPQKLTSRSAIRDLEFEMQLMSRMSHKHVLRCIGTSVTGVPADRMFVVLSMLQMSLHDALPPPPLPDGTSTLARLASLKRWTLSRSLKLGLDLAIALRYLHDECFDNYMLLHRDIKPKNLGLMHDGRLVLFDFGISKLVKRDEPAEDGVPMTGMCGSLRYMAPEVAMAKPYNHKAEIYSFSIVLWEMVALRRPYESIVADDFKRRVCENEERPKIFEKKWEPQLCDLFSRSWAVDMRARPEAHEIVDELMYLLAAQNDTTGRRKSTPSGEPSATPSLSAR